METSRIRYFAPLAIALCLAATLETIHAVRSPTISADGIIFIKIAKQLPDAPRETFRLQDQHPGYPYMVLATTRVLQWVGEFGDPEIWMFGAMIPSMACGVLCVAAVWLLARNVFDVRVANVAALVYAALPVPVWNSGDAHSDAPHLLCYLLAAWLASIGLASGRLWPFACAGAVGSLAYWIRPEGLEVAIITQLCLIWQAFRLHWSWRHLGLASACLCGAAVLVAAPYPILAGKFTSKQLPFAKLHPVTTHISRVATEPEPAAAPPPSKAAPSEAASSPIPAPATPAPVDTAKRYNPRLVLKLLGKAVGAFLISFFQGLKFAFIPFYLLGYVALAYRKHERVHIALLVLLGTLHFVALLGVYILSGYIAHRHLLPIIGLSMPLVGLGVMTAAEFVAVRRQWAPQYVALATLAVCGAIVLPYSVRPLNREFVPVIAASEWIKQHAEPDTGVISNSPYVEFYGQVPVTYLSSAAPTLDAALARASTDARYDIVVLHVGAHDYHEEWIAQLAPHYNQVREIPDHLSGRHKDVLIFEAKQGHVRRPGSRQM